jgi:hypothetical protein
MEKEVGGEGMNGMKGESGRGRCEKGSCVRE